MKRKRAAPLRPATEHSEEAEDNPYELERLQLIKRNRQVLATLGLLDVQPPAPPSRMHTAGTRVKREKHEVPVEVLRRSKRAQGIAAEFETPGEQQRQDTVLSQRQAQALRVAHRPSTKCVDEKEVADHNKYRMSYMTEDALRRRIHKITNIPKMRNFVQLLQAEGRDELAQEAEAALADLLAQV